MRRERGGGIFGDYYRRKFPPLEGDSSWSVADITCPYAKTLIRFRSTAVSSVRFSLTVVAYIKEVFVLQEVSFRVRVHFHV
jgi:hypothetical protein